MSPSTAYHGGDPTLPNDPEIPILPAWSTYEGLGELKTVLMPEGQLAIDSPVPVGSNAASIVADLQRHGFEVLAWQAVVGLSEGSVRLRILARLREAVATFSAAGNL